MTLPQHPAPVSNIARDRSIEIDSCDRLQAVTILTTIETESFGQMGSHSILAGAPGSRSHPRSRPRTPMHFQLRNSRIAVAEQSQALRPKIAEQPACMRSRLERIEGYLAPGRRGRYRSHGKPIRTQLNSATDSKAWTHDD